MPLHLFYLLKKAQQAAARHHYEEDTLTYLNFTLHPSFPGKAEPAASSAHPKNLSESSCSPSLLKTLSKSERLHCLGMS